MATRLAPYQLDPLMTATEWLPEPPLAFASGNHHPDPKVGIALYGPRSFGTSRHKHEVHIGFIGTGEAVADAHDFYQRCADGSPEMTSTRRSPAATPIAATGASCAPTRRSPSCSPARRPCSSCRSAAHASGSRRC
jgi:hypothetical protein